MKDSKIQDIITKQILDEATHDEMVMLNEWRKESEENERIYQEYAQIWEASANYEPVDFKPNADDAYQKHMEMLTHEKSNVKTLATHEPMESTSTVKKTKFFSLVKLSRIAALFILVMGAYFAFNHLNTHTISAENGVQFVTLEDGSSIWLDEGAEITYKNGFGTSHRALELKGKAFFDVHRIESVPFTITSGKLDVTVLGTKFTVDTETENAVSVKSGKVAVKAAQKEITLQAHEKAIFSNDDFTRSAFSAQDVYWRNQDLSFSSAPLQQVVADINIFFDDRIILESDLNSLDCPFTSRSLAENSFENIIEILKVTYDLELVEKNDGKVRLIISDCK